MGKHRDTGIVQEPDRAATVEPGPALDPGNKEREWLQHLEGSKRLFALRGTQAFN